MKRIPIVIDTDPGVDDFFCMALACAYDETLDLRAICTMGGNHHTDVTTQNALDILALFGKDNIPVARGADSYLTELFAEPMTQFHGENGLGNITIPKSNRMVDLLPAWDKLYAEALRAEGDLILVAVAPLTNVAIALKKYPDLPNYLKKIVMMGGTTGHGNITPYAEANVGHDAEAAALVFACGVPVDMIGLNVTTACPIRDETFLHYGIRMNPTIRNIMEELIRFRNGEAMHDAVALATLLDDSIMHWEIGSVHVELTDVLRKGQTLLRPDAAGIHRVAVQVDSDRYNSAIAGMLRHL